MSTVVSREKLELLDRQDALASFKDRFLLPDGVLYLDGNSLGPLPAGAAERAAEVVNVEWGQGLIRSWNSAGWFEMPTRLGDKLGSLLGANPGETVVTDTTSLNLFKALASALRIQQVDGPGRRVIITERDNFPTDIYIAEGLAELLNSVGAETGIRYEVKLIDNETELRAALGEDTAVLSLSHVNYRTGSMWDMAAITEAVHEAGGLAIWDLAHAAGAVPVDLNAAKADYAVGCTYKYLNGGPGSPAFIWVNARHQDRFWQPLTGWWSHQAPFEMAEQYTPANDVRRFMCGTQPVTSMAMIEVGLDIAVEAEMELVRAKSLELTDLFIELVETRCAGHGLELITPREHGQRGSHVSFHHPNGYEIIAALIERGVIGDYREPAVLRFGITPLYLSRTDIWDAVEILREVLHTGHWQREEFAVRNAVT
ncbi:kynureninase [Arthrobacter sp. MYb211]|uniref:kynureninase n=1 Tax=Micrococcaceae TaxID=1268 RepID=UPI000CFE32A7|nr:MULTISPECIES: kynureninase [unclassified Arthrobacter]PRA03167.1 kynureninase [Arthrobacter sp. MYb229]PRA11940.1 kynureninase [Arthrobacter sp. MYb221]PRB49638.1 kynureninase [Arthrobacter sp. MYb216]PRC08297.1 kynureninase [Arthrobacter sp. MYb211]